MTTEGDGNYAWAPAAALLLAAAGAATFFLLRAPLESRRPAEPSPVLHSPRSEEFALARLWQDPLSAIHEDWNRSRDSFRAPYPALTLGDFARRIADLTREDAAERQLRLIAMMPGMPYAYDRETRRRQRHAVVTALGGNGYLPVDENRIGYFSAPAFVRRGSSVAVRQPILVGYERYEPGFHRMETPVWKSILVLWLNSQDFRPYPLHQISALLVAIDAERTMRDTTASPINVLLGPVDSGGMRSMLMEPTTPPQVVEEFLRDVAQQRRREAGLISSRAGDGPLGMGARLAGATESASDGGRYRSLLSTLLIRRGELQVLSPRATVPVEQLMCERRGDDYEECREKYRIENGKPDEVERVEAAITKRLGVRRFRSIVARDDLALKSIMEELRRRGACTKFDAKPMVVIVSNQDTVYGRLLDDVAREIQEALPAGECKFQVRDYGYLGGVDGETPEVAGSLRAGQGEGVDYETSEQFRVPLLFGARRESAVGPAQLDYVRRLSRRIAADGFGAEAVSNGQRFPPVAVGVLGLDVYDKSLILQALRDELPGVAFFTLDLDARLLDPDVNGWTRNLIVGSAYGLDFPKCSGGRFRDSYQTAFNRAASLASGPLSARGAGPAPPPRLFEIGRVRAVDITKGPNGVPLGCSSLESELFPGEWRRSIFWLVSPAIGLALFAFVMWCRLNANTAPVRRRQNGIVAVGGVVAAVALVAATRYYLAHEPWPFLEGVSSVPMIILSWTAGVFAVGILLMASGRATSAEAYVIEQMTSGDVERRVVRRRRRCLRAVTEGTITYGRGWKVVVGALRRLALVSTWRHDIAGSAPGTQKRAHLVWFEFRQRCGVMPTCVRVGARVVVAIVFVLVVLGRTSEDQPVVSHWHRVMECIDWIVGVAALVTVFYCRDTIARWQAFVRALGHYDVRGWCSARKASGNEVVERVRRTMDVLVRTTDLVEEVMVMPLGVMVLLVVARSTLFEGWNWTTELTAFYAGFAVYVVGSVAWFQLEAGRTRDALIERVSEERLFCRGRQRRECDLEIERIQGNREGAFVPWIQHPILQAIVVPLGGVGLIAALEVWLSL